MTSNLGYINVGRDMYNTLVHMIAKYELLQSQYDGAHKVFEGNRTLDDLRYFLEYLENRLEDLENE